MKIILMEDIDFCIRLRERGIKFIIHLQLKLYTSKESSEKIIELQYQIN